MKFLDVQKQLTNKNTTLKGKICYRVTLWELIVKYQARRKIKRLSSLIAILLQKPKKPNMWTRNYYQVKLFANAHVTSMTTHAVLQNPQPHIKGCIQYKTLLWRKMKNVIWMILSRHISIVLNHSLFTRDFKQKTKFHTDSTRTVPVTLRQHCTNLRDMSQGITSPRFCWTQCIVTPPIRACFLFWRINLLSLSRPPHVIKASHASTAARYTAENTCWKFTCARIQDSSLSAVKFAISRSVILATWRNM